MIEIRSSAYRRASFSLALGSFLVFCNLYLFQPLLPVLADEFQVSATQVNWIQAAGSLALAITLVPWALLSEIKGRYTVMMLSLYLMPVAGIIMLFANDLWVLALMRAIMGAALAGFAAVAVAYMAEEFSTNALMLAVGTYISANSLGGITGRIFGGVVSDAMSWQVAVAVMSLFTLLGAVVVHRLLPEQKHFIPSSSGSVRYYPRLVLQHLQEKELWFAMLIGGLNFALMVNLYSVMSFRLVEPPYSLPVGWVSLIFLCYLSGTLSARLSGRWRLTRNASTGILLGTAISASGMWVAAWESVVAMCIGLLLISTGSFFTHSLAYGWVSQRAKKAKAAATALYLVHYYIGGSLGGFFLIACWQHGGWNLVQAGGMVLYALIVWLSILLRRYESSEGAIINRASL